MSLNAQKTLETWHMIEKGGSVVAGVSGGADSLALLHFLCSLREPLGLRVFAAHVNHGLRGGEALRDEQHVEKICREWGVKLFICHANVREEAQKTGESEEQAGRRVRYEFFDRTAAETHSRIATAHTLSDSIETVILNLARGTGLKGICGIPPVRGNIIRPLIRDTRRDIEQYCLENQIEYVNDSTNFSRNYARNKIRLDVVPVLYEINPSFEKSAERFLTNFSADADFLLQMARLRLEESRIGKTDFNADMISKLEPPLICRVLSMSASECTGTEQEAVHIEGMRALLRKKSGRLQLKGGWFASVSGGILHFSPPSAPAEDYEYPLMPGINEACGYKISVRGVSFDKQNINNLKIIINQYLKNMIDCDKIIGTAVIRNRRQGDKIRMADRGVSKTLKKLMNEAKVPVESRNALPCVADSKGILWVLGFGTDERCMIDENTREAYLIIPEGDKIEPRY